MKHNNTERQRISALPDRELYRLTGHGDEPAFSELVTRYESFVFGITFDVLRNRDDAADAAQDAFLKVWRTAKDWRGDCEVKSWIYRIAKTTAIDCARARSARVTSPIDESFDTADTSPTPEEEIEARERDRIVRDAVASLPDAHREVIMLREFGSMSYREIAETTGVDIGTVKSRLSRARAELYDILKEKLSADGTKRTSEPS